MDLTLLSVKDKQLFDVFLHTRPHALCAYAFENIYSWSSLYEVSWAKVDQNLCVFFKDSLGCFLYLPPLGARISAQAVDAAFSYLRGANRYPLVARIENIEEEDAGFFRDAGYNVAHKFGDYVYRRAKLAALAGDGFKSQRASLNYCSKHYAVSLDEFCLAHAQECLDLYRAWAAKKKAAQVDPVFCGMIDDSYTCLEALCRQWKALACVGRVARIQGEIRAFSVGYRVHKDMFCIAFEIADASIKGLAQFIFRGFCRDLAGYAYINAMDDSGLINLRKAKLSYRPEKLVPAYIATNHG